MEAHQTLPLSVATLPEVDADPLGTLILTQHCLSIMYSHKATNHFIRTAEHRASKLTLYPRGATFLLQGNIA